MNLAALATGLDTLQRRAVADPLAYFVPTKPQLTFLSSTAPIKLARSGNQVGKTTMGLVDCIYRCLGAHPYTLVRAAPIEAWIVVVSWEQSLGIQQKLWNLLPKDAIDPETTFIPGRGLVGKVPIVRFRNGSVLRIRTVNQGALALAGSTIDFVLVDEPPPQSVWSELVPRVMRNRGRIAVTLTPVGAPLGWLKELAERGVVQDMHFPLTVENTTPIGGRPLLEQADIDRLEQQVLPMERRQRIHGDWDSGFAAGRVFQAFDPNLHVSDLLPEGECQVGIGIDHGSEGGSQVATLVVVSREGGVEGNPRFWVLDQVISTGATTPEQDARDILAMLRRNNMRVESVDRWVGDRKHGGRRWGGKKSNALLMQGFERELRLPVGAIPFRIHTAWKPAGSVFEGSRILHSAMLRGDFTVHTRCKALIEDLRLWEGDDDEHKHGIDSLRYGAVELVTRRLYVPHHVRIG